MSTGRPPRSHRELTDVWRERLRQSRAKYDVAKAQSRVIVADLKQGLFAAPDGSAALRNAGRTEQAARGEYMRVLKIFNDLVLYGKIPDEE